MNFSLFVVSVSISLLAYCAAPKPVLRGVKPASNQAGDLTREPMVQGKELAFSGFPDWCTTKKDGSENTCVTCERTSQNNNKKLFADLCFVARENFDPKIQCGLSLSTNTLGLKLLQCHTTQQDTSGDVSLPDDKAATALSTILFSLKSALQETYKDDEAALVAAEATVQFASDHVQDVLAGKNLEQTASDFVLLANKFLTTPVPEGTDRDALIVEVQKRLGELHEAFSGVEDVSISTLVSKVLHVAMALPNDRLGRAKDILTGPGLASLLEKRSTELTSAMSGWLPSTVGASTADELISQVKSAP